MQRCTTAVTVAIAVLLAGVVIKSDILFESVGGCNNIAAMSRQWRLAAIAPVLSNSPRARKFVHIWLCSYIFISYCHFSLRVSMHMRCKLLSGLADASHGAPPMQRRISYQHSSRT
jgi:hypothetical protein